MSDETLPPAEPQNDTEIPPAVIPAGFARHALSLALDDLHRAMLSVEALADSYARQLDDGRST